jgi:hypothetical protein
MKSIISHTFVASVAWVVAMGALARDTGQALASPAVASESTNDVSNKPAPLPKSLRGRWSNPASGHSDLIEIEVLEMWS